MRSARFTVVAVLLVGLVAAAREQPAKLPAPAATQDGISIYFSPRGGCTEAIVAEIAGAKKSLDVQAYSFTNTDIAKAVREAHERRVKVRVVLDKSQQTEKYTSATYLFNAGVPVLIDRKHAIAHNKIMIIDGKTIITGSFNFTKAAEQSNAENLLIIRNKRELLAAYQQNFDQHHEHAEGYVAPGR